MRTDVTKSPAPELEFLRREIEDLCALTYCDTKKLKLLRKRAAKLERQEIERLKNEARTN